MDHDTPVPEAVLGLSPVVKGAAAVLCFVPSMGVVEHGFKVSRGTYHTRKATGRSISNSGVLFG